MPVFSMRTLAAAWTGLAGTAVAAAVALQASYVPPAPMVEPPAVPVAVPEPVTPLIAPVPFENRSLLAMLPPPDIRPHPAPPRVVVAEPHPLPVPPVPPAPVHVARSEPRRFVARPMPEPAYAPAEPYGWGRRLPYPGQYAMDQPYYGGRYGRGPYGWEPQY